MFSYVILMCAPVLCYALNLLVYLYFWSHCKFQSLVVLCFHASFILFLIMARVLPVLWPVLFFDFVVIQTHDHGLTCFGFGSGWSLVAVLQHWCAMLYNNNSLSLLFMETHAYLKSVSKRLYCQVTNKKRPSRSSPHSTQFVFWVESSGMRIFNIIQTTIFKNQHLPLSREKNLG